MLEDLTDGRTRELSEKTTTGFGRRVGLLLLIALVLLVFTKSVPGLCNDTSRLATAESIVEHGTFSIDRSYFLYTCDKIEIDGRYYSDKTPVLGAYLSIPYWVLHNGFGLSFKEHPRLTYYLLSLLSSGVSAIALVVFFFLLLREKGASENLALFLTGALYFSTIALPYSLVINNHIASASLIVAIYYALHRERYRTAGLLMALTFTIDLGAVLLLLPLLFERKPFRIIAAGAPVVLLFLAWHYYMSGSILPFDLNPELFKFEDSMFADGEELSGTGFKHEGLQAYLIYLFNFTIGNRGLITYSPLCLLGVIGIFANMRKFRVVAVSLLLFVIVTTLTTNNYSGWAYGVRWHLLVIPLLVYSAYPLLERPSPALRAFTTLLIIAGTASAVVGAINPWTMTGYQDSSLRAQFSAEYAYVQRAYEDGIMHLQGGRIEYAEERLKDCLRRDRDFKPAKEILAMMKLREASIERSR